MAHFAQLDENNVVVNVVVVNNDDCLDENGNESESVGVTFCERLFGGKWLQTSYNNNMRKQYACIGGTYDQVKDIFINPQPYSGWVLNENSDWVAPTEMPSEGLWYWDDDSESWKEIIVEA